MKSKYHFKFEDLLVYQKAMNFGEVVDALVKTYPKYELYALSSQFRRASDSIALNIAEGYPGSDAQFINHAIYSANECVSCSSKSRRRSYISFEQDEENRKLISELTKMLSSLRKKILERTNS